MGAKDWQHLVPVRLERYSEQVFQLCGRVRILDRRKREEVRQGPHVRKAVEQQCQQLSVLGDQRRPSGGKQPPDLVRQKQRFKEKIADDESFWVSAVERLNT